MPRSVRFFFFIWRNWFGKYLSTIWNLVPAYLIWLIWPECNACIFEDKARTLEHLKCLLFRTLLLWARVWGCTNCTTVSNFLVSISFSSWSFCICFLVQSVHHREHDVQVFLNKSFITYKKIKKKKTTWMHKSWNPRHCKGKVVSSITEQTHKIWGKAQK